MWRIFVFVVSVWCININFTFGCTNNGSLRPLSIIFQLHVYHGSQFFLWKNQSNWRKPLTFHKSLSNFISRKQQTLLPSGKISGKRNKKLKTALETCKPRLKKKDFFLLGNNTNFQKKFVRN